MRLYDLGLEMMTLNCVQQNEIIFK